MALLAVLMLRGPQTPGELKQRTERLHRSTRRAEVEEALARLAERELVARLDRRPGQKEERWTQLLGGDDETAAAAAAPNPVSPAAQPAGLAERVAALERQVAELRRLLAEQPPQS